MAQPTVFNVTDLIKVYDDKKAGGQYVTAAKQYFIKCTPKQFIKLVEYCKKAQLTKKQGAKWKQLKTTTWGVETNNPFANSAPTKTMNKIESEISAILTHCEVPEGVIISWGAFVQAFDADIVQLTRYNWALYPRATSFHYSRAFFMAMPIRRVYIYIKQRMNACIAVTAYVEKSLGKLSEIYKPGDTDNARALTTKMKGIAKDIVGKALEKNDKGETNQDLFMKAPLSKTKTLDFFRQVMAAFPVRGTMLLQAKDLRQEGIKPEHKVLIAKVFKVVTGTNEKFSIKDNTSAYMQAYWKRYSEIRFACAMMRRIASGDTRQSGEKKDYTEFVIDIEKEEKYDWDTDDASDKIIAELFANGRIE
jgi:hypothetical protein